jgi:hypothetical protein
VSCGLLYIAVCGLLSSVTMRAASQLVGSHLWWRAGSGAHDPGARTRSYHRRVACQSSKAMARNDCARSPCGGTLESGQQH